MHVHLSAEKGETKLLLDGVDITRSVLSSGFQITLRDHGLGALVAMTIRADRLTVEGDALIQAAIREAADATAVPEEQTHG